jgi:uncharacterized membrane protein YkoI
MVLVLAAPYAFAKKDLFANEPAGTHTSQAQSLVTTSADGKAETPTLHSVEPTNAQVKAAPEEKKVSYIETQLIRFKGHLVETKEDLFGSKTSSKKIKPDAKALAENTAASDDSSSEQAKPELPVISPTEAAQRAQTYSNGQVINVRQYQDEGNQRYAVKLLQKNGRMKTINLNAFNGELIEESTDQ